MIGRRLAVGAGVALAFAVAAAPAGAVQIGIAGANTGPMPPDGEMAVVVQAAPGETNHVTVRATDPTPVPALDPTYWAGGWPQTVTVTDRNATFDPAPPGTTLPCEIIAAHTARCNAPVDTFFEQATVRLGDADNRLQFAADSVPLREQFSAGDGNDNVSTGTFAGDVSYRWASATGGGKDTVRIGTAVRTWPSGTGSGLALYTEDGDDTVFAANGAFDEVNCGSGADTLLADPSDSESVYVEPPGTCETRVLPGVG